MVKNIISIAIVVLAVAIVIINFKGSQEKQVEEAIQQATASQEIVKGSSANVTYTAPDFELTTLDGETVRLSDYLGKKVILNFWATWCPPCKEEMPHMQKIYEEYKNQGVEMLAVNLTSQDKGKEVIAQFVKDHNLTFTVPLDEEGLVGQKYQVMTVPTSYMIDTQGNIVETIVGPMDENMMKKLIHQTK